VEELRAASGDSTSSVVQVFGSAVTPVLFLPGLGVPINYYSPFLEAWASRGFLVYAVELRGMPLSSTADVISNNFGYADILSLDIPAAIQRAKLPIPFVITGHSLGGQLAMLYSGRYPDQISAIVAIASGSSHPSVLPTFAARMLRRLQISTIVSISAVLGYWPGHRLGFGGRQPRTMIRDWAREANTRQYRLAGSDRDDERSLADIRAPVLTLTLEGDRLISRRASDVLSGKASSARIEALHLDLGEQVDHFRWARRQAQSVAVPVAIADWLSRTSQQVSG
jgi:predicted alpha/beta hydrolase